MTEPKNLKKLTPFGGAYGKSNIHPENQNNL